VTITKVSENVDGQGSETFIQVAMIRLLVARLGRIR